MKIKLELPLRFEGDFIARAQAGEKLFLCRFTFYQPEKQEGKSFPCVSDSMQGREAHCPAVTRR